MQYVIKKNLHVKSINKRKCEQIGFVKMKRGKPFCCDKS